MFVAASSALTSTPAPPAGFQAGDLLILDIIFGSLGVAFVPVGWKFAGCSNSEGRIGDGRQLSCWRLADGTERAITITGGIGVISAYRHTSPPKTVTGNWPEPFGTGQPATLALPAVTSSTGVSILARFTVAVGGMLGGFTFNAWDSDYAEDAVAAGAGWQTHIGHSVAPLSGTIVPSVTATSFPGAGVVWWGQAYVVGDHGGLMMLV